MYPNLPGPGDLWYGHDDDEDELDVTDDRDEGWYPDDDPDYIDGPEADYIYDPLSRRGFE